jgi:hypothetical protein
LSGLGLYQCTQYFSIVKKETGSRPVDVGILPNHVNFLCTCEIGVCVCFSFQTCLSHKGLVGNWLSIKLPIFPTNGIRAMVTFLGQVSGRVGFGVVSLSATRV